MREAQHGSPEAFAELVERYQDRIYNTCYRLCHNEADALDLTQSAFMRALEALPRFEARSAFFTWIYRIAVNLALSGRRRDRRRRTLSLEDDGPLGVEMHERASGFVAESAALEQQETHARLAEALEALDAEFRAPLVLKDVEDLDYATIAEILDIPVGTVKSRIFRARMLLRQKLEPEALENKREPGAAGQSGT